MTEDLSGSMNRRDLVLRSAAGVAAAGIAVSQSGYCGPNP